MKLGTMRIFRPLTLVAACTVLGVIGFTMGNNKLARTKLDKPLSIQRSDEKVIELKKFSDEPYEYDELSIKKTNLVSGQKFNPLTLLSEKEGASAENWLEGLEFSFKNKTESKINYLRFEMNFPETSAGGPMMVYQIILGVSPNASNEVKMRRPPFSLDAEATYRYTVSERELRKVKTFLASRGFQLENLNKIVIRVGEIIYDDGKRWSQAWYKSNPDLPSKWEKITKQP